MFKAHLGSLQKTGISYSTSPMLSHPALSHVPWPQSSRRVIRDERACRQRKTPDGRPKCVVSPFGVCFAPMGSQGSHSRYARRWIVGLFVLG